MLAAGEAEKKGGMWSRLGLPFPGAGKVKESRGRSVTRYRVIVRKEGVCVRERDRKRTGCRVQTQYSSLSQLRSHRLIPEQEEREKDRKHGHSSHGMDVLPNR